ncbi:hypothetical protein L249_7199 [Ophiocordyceps polyrhachis-furcata BCC 54312]|uniref:Cysteine synthase 1 n=1 Tax=Ophiocordyceps polyrhachis-furcata BCC 54312 TaxID=1330021 RepID=A0A367LAM2_9HYPO|nr:hypothetical protein L249_7199 [Ophiocordyceps polyrhachis-furcata BCC 54312]
MEPPRKPSLDLEKELTCSTDDRAAQICTELLYQPLTLLDCLHTFCGACLKEWFGFQALTTAPFTCPSCRSAVRGSRHNATVVTLLDMLVAAQPGKARSQADKDEMARKYQPGDEVPPKVAAGRESKKHDDDDDDERLLEQVREMSLREALTPRRRNERNERSQEDEHQEEGEGEEEGEEEEEEEERRRRQVEHQSSLRSLIGSAERDIEREIEDFARQIQEEGLLDGLDLDNIDLSRDDELSRRVTEAYRRRQRRGRSQRQDEAATTRRHRATSSSNRSGPPSASLEVRGVRSRRRTASGGRSATAPLLSVGGAAQQQAARSQTELVPSRLDVPAAAARDQRRSSSTPSVAAFAPPAGGGGGRGGESNASFASRAPQWNPTTDSRTDAQPVSRNRPQLYPEPSISCSRCSRRHIEYELHYSCALCAGGQWTVCLDCYRAAKGCLHWFGFGHGAWIKWDKAHQLDPTTARPHVLTASRYLRPPSIPGGADGRRTLTWHDPRTRLETGTFCARCLVRANECYWRCDVCNDGDWGFCTDCVNGGLSCSHMLLPLAYEPTTLSQQEQQQEQASKQPIPGLRRQWTGRPQSSLGPFKPLPVYSDAICAVCQESMAASQVRYHCFTCFKGYYDVCPRCYSSLETQGKISAENGASGWRRCLGGHRMAVIGWASGKVGRWRYVEREPVGGRSLVEGGGAGNAHDGTELWSWPSASETRRRRVTVDVAASTGAGVGFPPDGGLGMRAQARWAWYPAAGADDELLFPRGAEVREVEDVNGDWFFGVHHDSFDNMFRHSARRLTQQSANACLGNRIAVSHAQGITPGFTGAIGNTPLIRLQHLSEETGCTILGKAEFMNPGGSVKDRAALWIVREAERRGELQSGGTVVEGTAGNTGIGLAHVCRARGYKLVIYMPDTQSQAKVDLLRLLGAEVYPVPAVPWDNEENYNHQARRHAARVQGAVWTDQFDNVANRQAHIDSTGPEIWAQTGGKMDAFVCATGTGGTLAGVTRFLKEKSGGAVRCYLADPPGSVLYSVITSDGKSKERTGTGSITEGIGQGRVTENLKPDLELLDGAFHVPDEETIAMVYRCLDEEGLYLGASTALNVVAARDVARKLGPRHTVVTILCDGAYRYADRLFSRSWLAEKKLLDAIPKPLQRYIALP